MLKITTRGYVRVLRADRTQISQHVHEREAYERVSKEPDGLYYIETPDSEVRVIGSLAPQIGDTEAPSIPGIPNLVTKSATTISVTAAASTDNVGVTGYQWYLNGTPVTTTASPSHTFTGLTPSTAYAITVSAFDAAGNSSAQSQTLNETTSANAAPVWNVGTQALTTNQSYNLDLLSVCSDADTNPITFSIVSGTLPTGLTFSSSLKTVSGTPTTVQTQVVTFRASDGITFTDQAITFEVLNADTTAPPVPTMNAPTNITESTMSVSWGSVSDTVVAGARTSGGVQYILQRATDSGFTTGVVTEVAQSGISTNLSGLSAGTQYWFRVRSQDAAGNQSSFSSSVSASTVAQSVMFFQDNFESGNFNAWNAQGSLSIGSASPMSGSFYATINRTNGDSGIDGCYKQYGTAGSLPSFIRNFYAQFGSRWTSFSGGWPTLSKVAIFQYHESAAGPGSNSTRKYQVIVDVNSGGFYVVELIQWDPATGNFVTSALLTQSTAAVRFGLKDVIRLRVQLDTNGSGSLGAGNGNGIIQLWVNGVLVINSSTVNIVNGNSTVGMGRIFCAGPTAWTSGATTQSWDDMQVASDPSLLSPMTTIITLASWRNSQSALTWVYPPTDAQSQSHWRSRMAPTDTVGDNPWEIPLAVRGGGYPYNYSIITGPTGLQIIRVGYDTGQPPYYDYLRWANPQVGTHPITIRCTDQNGNSVDRSWTLQVFADTDTTRFMYLNSATGNNANSGARASPKADVNGWWNSDLNNSTHQTKQIFYIGSFNLGGVSGVSYTSGQFRLKDFKPKTHVGIGTVNITGNGAWWSPESGVGFYFANMIHGGAFVTDTNMHIRAQTPCFADGGVFKYTFTGSGSAAADSTNSSGLMLASVDTTDNNFAFVGCTVDGLPGNTSGFKNYNGLDGVIEGWTFKNCTGASSIMVHQKGGDIRRWAVRGCKAIENNTNSVWNTIEYINDPIARHDIESCWNNVKVTSNLYFYTVSGGADNFARIDSYRNNIAVTHSELNNDTGTTTWEDDIIQHSGSFTNGVRNLGSGSAVVTDCQVATSGILNPTTNLRVGGPDGVRGCEMVLT